MLVYSKNYRGAPNGWSTVGSANFLVGENSTGKSSYGLLLKSIFSSEFQISNELVISDLREYDFNDYHSKLTKDNEIPKVVTIGFITTVRKKGRKKKSKGQKKKLFLGKVASYIPQDGEIVLDTLTTITETKITSLSFRDSKVFYTSKLYENLKTEKTASSQLLKFHSTPDADRVAIPNLPPERPPNHIWTALLEYDPGSDSPTWKYSPRVLDGVGHMHAFAPVRSKPERVYFPGAPEFDSGGLYSLSQLKESLPIDTSFERALESFGKASGLFESVDVIELHNLERSAFALKFLKNGASFFSDELGFGVSQVVPLVVDALSGDRVSCLYIEQPELHLHPKAQAAFGDLLFELYKRKRRFLVETHSDYIIDRFRILFAKSSIKTDSADIKFFYNYKKENRLKQIEILPDGSLGKQPVAYRKFFLREKLLKFEAL